MEAWEKLVETRLMVGGEMDMLYKILKSDYSNPFTSYILRRHWVIYNVVGQEWMCEVGSESCGRKLMGNW